MLSLRPQCEACARPLPTDTGEAYICSYECTFCADCVESRFQGRCPNCGGDLQPRPRRIKPDAPAATDVATEKVDGIEVVAADIDDLDTLVPLFDQYRVFYEAASDPAGARQFLQARLVRCESTILIARRSGVAVGFCQLYPIFSSVSMESAWLLNDLYVSETERCHGIGRRLLEAAASWSRRQSAGWLMLQTHTSNCSAQRLYEASGWIRDEEFLTYYTYPGREAN